jgi:hypothetical protein
MFADAKATPNRKRTAYAAASHHPSATSTITATYSMAASHSAVSPNTGAISNVAAPYSSAAPLAGWLVELLSEWAAKMSKRKNK